MSDAPYLAIAHWDEEQVDKDGKVIATGGKGTHYFKRFVAWDEEYAHAKLTLFQRAILDGMRMLRTRAGRHAYADPTTVARALNASHTEAPRVANAIHTLVERGFLVPCFQQLDFAEESRIEESRRDETKRRGESPNHSGSQGGDESKSPNLPPYLTFRGNTITVEPKGEFVNKGNFIWDFANGCWRTVYGDYVPLEKMRGLGLTVPSLQAEYLASQPAPNFDFPPEHWQNDIEPQEEDWK